MVPVWSLSGPYAAPAWSVRSEMWSRRGPFTACLVLTWFLPGPGAYMVHTRSIPGPNVINSWSIFGSFVVPTWSIPGLARFLHGFYVFPTCPYMVYVVYTWTLLGPGPYLVPTGSFPDLYAPNMVSVCSLWAPYEVPK